MPRRDDRALAQRLARVLDGEPAREAELVSLVQVLERATEPVRFDVSREEVERALADTAQRGGTSRRRDRPPRIAIAFGVAAAVAVAVLAVTFIDFSGIDVEGKALAALERGGQILRVDERIAPVRRGTFKSSERITWLDPRRGRLFSLQFVRGRTVETTLVEPGRIVHYEPQRNLAVTARSCRALEGGCPVDQVAFYRQALLRKRGVRSRATILRGRQVYRLTFPVQSLARAVSVQQQVDVDAKTFLPRRIVWLERRGSGAFRPASVIRITSVEHISRESIELQRTFELSLPEGTRILQRVASGRSLRRLGSTRVTPAELAGVRPPVRWLGRSFDGRWLLGIEQVRWNAGAAYRLRYRGLTVWNYSAIIPPDLLAGRLGAEPKVVPFLHGVARFYSTRSGRLVLELQVGRRSVAVVAPDLYKQQLLRVLRALKPLR